MGGQFGRLFFSTKFSLVTRMDALVIPTAGRNLLVRAPARKADRGKLDGSQPKDQSEEPKSPKITSAPKLFRVAGRPGSPPPELLD
jgi:hypothetical protein